MSEIWVLGMDMVLVMIHRPIQIHTQFSNLKTRS